jgi:hypothetical protein
MRATEVAMQRSVIFLIAFSLFACNKSEPQTAQPATPAPTPAAQTQTTAPPPATTSSAPVTTAAPPSGIATADGETEGITAVAKELKRTSGDTVTLKLTIVNNSSKRMGFGYAFGDKAHEITDFSSVGGLQLIDPVGKKKYFVARDTENKCVCSRDLKDLDAGKSINVWAKFPAPPEGVDKISIVIPHFTPMDDVPISK